MTRRKRAKQRGTEFGEGACGGIYFDGRSGIKHVCYKWRLLRVFCGIGDWHTRRYH